MCVSGRQRQEPHGQDRLVISCFSGRPCLKKNEEDDIRWCSSLSMHLYFYTHTHTQKQVCIRIPHTHRDTHIPFCKDSQASLYNLAFHVIDCVRGGRHLPFCPSTHSVLSACVTVKTRLLYQPMEPAHHGSCSHIKGSISGFLISILFHWSIYLASH